MAKKAFRTINLSRNGMYGQLKFRIRSVLTIQIKSFITICPSLMAISQAIIVTQPNIPLSRLHVCLQWSAMSRCPPTITDQCLIRMTSTSSGVWSVPMVTISVDVFPMCCTTLTGHINWSPEARMFYGDIQDNSGPSSFLPLCVLCLSAWICPDYFSDSPWQGCGTYCDVGTVIMRDKPMQFFLIPHQVRRRTSLLNRHHGKLKYSWNPFLNVNVKVNAISGCFTKFMTVLWQRETQTVLCDITWHSQVVQFSSNYESRRRPMEHASTHVMGGGL